MSLKLGAEEAAANYFPLKKSNYPTVVLEASVLFCVCTDSWWTAVFVHRTVVETLQITFWVICLLGEILPPKPRLQGWALAIQAPLPGHSFAN